MGFIFLLALYSFSVFQKKRANESVPFTPPSPNGGIYNENPTERSKKKEVMPLYKNVNDFVKWEGSLMHKSAVLLKGPVALDLGEWIKTLKRKVALKLKSAWDMQQFNKPAREMKPL